MFLWLAIAPLPRRLDPLGKARRAGLLYATKATPGDTETLAFRDADGGVLRRLRPMFFFGEEEEEAHVELEAVVSRMMVVVFSISSHRAVVDCLTVTFAVLMAKLKDAVEESSDTDDDVDKNDDDVDNDDDDDDDDQQRVSSDSMAVLLLPTLFPPPPPPLPLPGEGGRKVWFFVGTAEGEDDPSWCRWCRFCFCCCCWVCDGSTCPCS